AIAGNTFGNRPIAVKVSVIRARRPSRSARADLGRASSLRERPETAQGVVQQAAAPGGLPTGQRSIRPYRSTRRRRTCRDGCGGGTNKEDPPAGASARRKCNVEEGMRDKQ